MTEQENHPASLAHELASLPLGERQKRWELLTADQRGEVIPYLNDGVMQGLLEQMPKEAIAEATNNMEVGDIAEVLECVDEEVAQEIIDSLSESDKHQVEQSLQYAEDVAGRLLDYEVLTVSTRRTVGQVLQYIRREKLPPYTDQFYVVGRQRRYVGAIALSTILEADESELLSDLPQLETLDRVAPDMPLTDLAALFRQKHYVSLPVVSEDGQLLGRITLDDAMSVLQDEADHQLLGLAGLDEEEDLFASPLRSARRRALWLGLNLLTALLASWVIGLFEVTLQQLVALAVLMPVVASMGGIAGSQTLTLVIRGIALKQIHRDNQRSLLIKELAVGVINGVVWSIGVGLVAFLWFNDSGLGLVIAIAILLNLLAASVAGLVIPVILDRLKIDPALSGSVILTTVTDVVGFVTFLGLGTWWLL